MVDALGAEKFVFSDDAGSGDTGVDLTKGFPDFFLTPVIGGSYSYDPPASPTLYHPGAYMGGDFSESIFGKVYFEPSEIKAGLIVDTTNHEVFIWNSNWDTEAVVSQVQIVNSTGLVHETPATPFNIPRGGDATYILQVLKDGPPIQSSTVIYTINALTFDIKISGQRVLAFNFDCDWREIPKIKYGFHTIIFRNEYFHEQRRPLKEKPIRSIQAAFTFRLQAVERFVNEVRNLSKKIIGVPIYTEPMFPIGNVQGQTVLNVNQNLNEYFNLKNYTTLVLIRSFSNQWKSELKSLVSVAAGSITIDLPVVGSFPENDTVIFPVMIGIIDSKNFVEETAMLVTASIEFKEIRPDGG